jgi:hypothetical protein
VHKITAKQCRAARSLLKWNIQDLGSRVQRIPSRRIDSFEHSAVHIMEWENDELVTVFRKAGIRFNDMEVTLEKEETEHKVLQVGSGEGVHIVLDADQSVLSDSSAEKTQSNQLQDAASKKKRKEEGKE